MIQSQMYRSSTSRPCMHARPDVGIEPGVTIFVLKNHVKNNFGERLGHGTNHDSTRAGVNRAFSARKCFIFLFLGRCPRLQVKIAPSAKNSSRKVARGRALTPKAIVKREEPFVNFAPSALGVRSVLASLWLAFRAHRKYTHSPVDPAHFLRRQLFEAERIPCPPSHRRGDKQRS